jgi:hypothetical protein
VSLYEALSLVVSSVGTLGTVYVGLRQLRQSTPAPAYPVPAPYGRAVTHDPMHHPQPRRPPSVTAAGVLLYVAASAHPFFVALYYAIRLATAPRSGAAELGDEGIVDVLIFGGIAFLSALLGVFIIRGSRVALRCAWVLGVLSMIFLCLLAVGATLAMLGAEEGRPRGYELLFLGYFAFVLVMYTVGAILLTSARSRAFFRRA